MFLSRSDFQQIIQQTPLISIDLIVRNEKNEILLGLRNNRPARNYWFVPGGRVLKDESLSVAFERLTTDEIGLSRSIVDTDFIGVYEHLYSDSAFDETVSTHYVVLAYTFFVNSNDINLPDQQHRSYQWCGEDDIAENRRVHQNTKNYFINQGRFC